MNKAMKRASYLLLFVTAAISISCVVLPTAARASVRITEVMYDPPGSGAQWIEVYNPDASPVTLIAGTKGWRVDDGGSSKHVLVDPASASNGGGRGSLTIPPAGFAIITNDPTGFIAQFGGSYSVIKSAISPNQTSGATIALIDDQGSVVDSVTYATAMGGKNDGNALHRSGDALLAAPPDPGVYTAADSVPTGATSDASIAATTTPAIATSVAAPLPPDTLLARITSQPAVSVGAGSYFVGAALTPQGVPLADARYIWNFGDGATGEGRSVFHTYAYPGKYNVMLTVASGIIAGTARQIVAALPAEVGLLSEPDGSVMLLDQSAQDLDVSLWSITSGTSTFVLPQGTTILGGQGVRVSSATMGMYAQSDAVLRYINGTIAATAATAVAYVPPPVEVAPPAPSAPPVAASTAEPVPVITETPRVPAPAESLSPEPPPVVIEAAPEVPASATPPKESAQDPIANQAAVAAAPFSPTFLESVLALVAVILLGIAGVWYAHAEDARRWQSEGSETSPSAAEFDIE